MRGVLADARNANLRTGKVRWSCAGPARAWVINNSSDLHLLRCRHLLPDLIWSGKADVSSNNTMATMWRWALSMRALKPPRKIVAAT